MSTVRIAKRLRHGDCIIASSQTALAACRLQSLGMQTPFASSDEQAASGDVEEEPAARFSSITEAAEDIADNWDKAPRPRADAQRHSIQQHGKHQEHHGKQQSPYHEHTM